MNGLTSQHDARRGGGTSRSYGGRATHQRGAMMRGGMPWSFVAIAADCVAKPAGLEGASRGSPG